MNILTIGYTTEGSTDERFLGNIIRRTFEDLAYECEGQIEVYEPEHIRIKGESFIEDVINVAREVSWANILCVHTDADNRNDQTAFQNKIEPTIARIDRIDNEDVCNNIVAVVPVQMTEAWMLADRDLFRNVIGTNKSIMELRLPSRDREIEQLNDPKRTIEEAIRVATVDFPRRRRRINISETYIPVSQRVNLEALSYLPSYLKFRENAKNALITLNYIN